MIAVYRSPSRRFLSLALSAGYLAVAWSHPWRFIYAGFLAGFFIVYSMLDVRWRPRNAFFATIVIASRLTVSESIRAGLVPLFPRAGLSDYCIYFLLGVVLAVSPLVFMKMGLLEKVERAGA